MLRVVVDANVWISGLIKSGAPAQVVSLFAAGAFKVCFSERTLAELDDVLKRPKILAHIVMEDAELLVELINSRATLVRIETVPTVGRDPKDDIYLACADVADADVLVTGDKDLLVLQTYGRTRIMTPAQFLALLSE